METINLANDEVVYNIYDETTFSQNESVVIHNNANNELFVSRSTVAPEVGEGVPIYQGQSTLVIGKQGENIYVSGAKGTVVVQRSVDAVVPMSLVDLPKDVWTSNNPRTRRLQVDSEETGFEEGRIFYCLAEQELSSSQKSAFKFVFTTDIIVENFFFSTRKGAVRLTIYQGGTDQGDFSTPVNIFAANTTSEVENNGYTTQTTKFSGGTYNEDGEVIDYSELKTDSNENRSISETGEVLNHVGLPAGTYYLVFQEVSGTASAEFKVRERWQERPSQYV